MNLKPCPFCGFLPLSIGRDERNKVVACRNALCYVQPAFGSSQIDAGEVWNTRASDWRPIAEAPKDGTKFLIYDPLHDEVYIAFFYDGEMHWPMMRYSAAMPTHFHPLPEPPKL